MVLTNLAARPPAQGKLTAKMLRIMKLPSIFFFVACMAASARSTGQTITFSGKNVPLTKLFTVIKEQTGYVFFYDQVLLQQAKPVSLEVKDAALETVLNQIFSNQPFSWSIVNKTITIVGNPIAANGNAAIVNEPPPLDITGRITNAQGEPLSGASIIIKRTGKGDIADANGKFSIKNVNSDDVIEISFTGYKTQSIKVGDRSNFTLVLDVAVDELDRVQIQAYGKTSRRLATGNIATVTAEEIERQPVMNPLLALQGKVAGLDVTQTNGFASAPIKVELRGRNAIGTDPSHTFPSDPLYIIDGVPLTILELTGTSGYAQGSRGFIQSGYNGPAGGQSPFFSLNPADIESVEVLKDADATAIYGSRGANGVVLITTKKGKPGKTKFDLRIQQGITKQTRFWKMMNTEQYLQMRREALKNDGITPSLNHGDYDLLQWDTTRFTDWQKFLYGHTGKATEIQTALAGGNSQTSFRIGAGYNHTTNILTVSGADQRASLSMNLSHKTIDQKLSIVFINNYSFSKSDMVNLPGAITLPPNAPAVYDSAGNLNFAGWGNPDSDASRSFSFGALKRTYVSKTDFLNTNLVLGFQPFKGFTFTSSFGLNSARADQDAILPIASMDPRLTRFGGHLSAFNDSRSWIIEPQTSYETFISNGKLSVIVGGSWQSSKTSSSTVDGYGYTSDDLIQSISSAPIMNAYDAYGEYRYAALFGRITYNWRNRYIVNFNGRRDGSSRFGPGKQYGNFGSVGAAWIFSEEKFFKDHMKFFSFGKLRGSYGTTGSDGVGDYQYLTQWSSNGTQPYTGITSLVPILHANPNFHWQTNRKLEGSIDLGFWKDRVGISVTYYRNRCGDQLVQFPTPSMTGFSGVTANFPALVQNAGWEFTLNANILNTNNFKWAVNFNVALNRNKLLAYPNIEQSPFTSKLVIGQSLNVIRLLHLTGVDPQTGEYVFEDKNKDGQIKLDYTSNELGDFYYFDRSPKFLGGLGTTISYKAIQVNLFFNIKRQIGINALYQTPVPYAGALGNQPEILFGKQWSNPGDIASVGRFTTQGLQTGTFFSASDALFTDASFIRLSNLAVSYRLPSSYIKRIGMQACSLFFHTNNLFTITNYKGIDPETQNFESMPPARTMVIGVNFNF